MHQIRSRGHGIIRAVYRKPGEAVHALEPICKLELRNRPTDAAGASDPAARPYEAPSQQAGLLLFIGTPLRVARLLDFSRPGEPAPAERLATITTDGKLERYRWLDVGDRVEAGQVIALLDDRLARREVAIKEAKVTASEADLVASEATRDEAAKRYETQRKLWQQRATSQEDLRGAELTWQRYAAEATAKREAVRVAELEWKEAQAALALYEIRSVVRGVIKAIYKQPGEGVKYLEPVFRIAPVSQ